MSNPWTSVMPGGVEFSIPGDEEVKWSYDDPAETGAFPHAWPWEAPEPEAAEGLVSTAVDTTRPVQAPTAVAPVLPLPLPSVAVGMLPLGPARPVTRPPAASPTNRAGAGRPRGASPQKRPVALTARDQRIVELLGRYGGANYLQVAGAFGTSVDAMRRRMPRLAREGLVVRKTVGQFKHSVWLPTESGLKWAGLDLSVPKLSWGSVEHTLGLVSIGIRFEALGETVVTEREIRAADTRDRPTSRSQAAGTSAGSPGIWRASGMNGSSQMAAPLYVVGGNGYHYGHIPDMVLLRPLAADGTAQSVAIELELNHKPASEWRKILLAYKKAPHIAGVVYYINKPKVRNGITAAAKEVGAERLVILRDFEQHDW